MNSDQALMGEEESPHLVLESETIEDLNETVKWTTFLAIIGFIFIGLMVVAGIFSSTFFSRFYGEEMSQLPVSGFFFGFIYVVMALIYFFPILYLFRFSSRMRKAIRQKSGGDLVAAISNLKAHYRYIGILMIVLLSLYLIIFIMSGLIVGLM